jgi:hypothetical protein
MGIYQSQTAADLLKEVQKVYNLDNVSPALLLEIISELFDLQNKKVNLLQIAFLNGKVEQLTKKHNIKKNL